MPICNNVILGDERFLKQRSRDKNHPELHPGQFDFHYNASSSLAPIWSLGYPFWLTYSTSPYLTYSTSYSLRHRVGWISMRNVPLCYYLQIVHLSEYKARSSSNITWWGGATGRLDATKPSLLCSCQACYQY